MSSMTIAEAMHIFDTIYDAMDNGDTGTYDVEFGKWVIQQVMEEAA